MKTVVVWFPVTVLMLAMQAPPTQPPPSLTDAQLRLLAAIKSRARANLLAIPNYTCVETIERSRRRGPRRESGSMDVLRMEVAVVGGKEMFSWPGEGDFQDRDLIEMVGGGTIGTGSFALHARAVFLSDAPRFRFGAYEQLDNRDVVRFDFQVPQHNSGYRIKVPPHAAEVAYFGSFWADRTTFDLVRLRVEATEIPPELEMARVSEVMAYQRVGLATGDFLLPRSSELVMEGIEGSESRNRIRFDRCRHYTGESVITFEDAPADSHQTQPAPEVITLPANLALSLELESVIDETAAAAGDPLSARLLHDVKWQRKTLIAKGARAEGRIVRLQRYSTPTDYWIVGLRFDRLIQGNRQARFLAELEGTSPVRSIVFPPNALFRNRQFTARLTYEEPPPGVGYLYWAMAPLRTSRGLRVYWRTVEPREEETK